MDLFPFDIGPIFPLILVARSPTVYCHFFPFCCTSVLLQSLLHDILIGCANLNPEVAPAPRRLGASAANTATGLFSSISPFQSPILRKFSFLLPPGKWLKNLWEIWRASVFCKDPFPRLFLSGEPTHFLAWNHLLGRSRPRTNDMGNGRSKRPSAPLEVWSIQPVFYEMK